MAKQTINVGTSSGAGDGEGIRDAFIKANNNFDEVYTDLDTKVDAGSITTSGLTLTGPALVGRTAATSGAVAALSATAAKALLALDQVSNTADADKPVSSATLTALNGKEGTITAGASTQYWRGDKTWVTLNKAAVGLGNVDNTTDLLKPVSTATQTALDLKSDTTHTHVAANITMASQRLLGRNTAASGGAEELTSTQVKSIIGLSNVSNTADADKPISTAAQTALDGKAPIVHTHEIDDVNGLQSALDGKANTGHTHTIANITGLAAQLVHSVTFYVGTPEDSVELNSVVDTNYTVVLLNSVAKAGVAATAETTIVVKKNNTEVGSIVFAASSTQGTISVPTAGDLVTSTGDVWTLEFPSSADATLARISVVLRN